LRITIFDTFAITLRFAALRRHVFSMAADCCALLPPVFDASYAVAMP